MTSFSAVFPFEDIPAQDFIIQREYFLITKLFSSDSFLRFFAAQFGMKTFFVNSLWAGRESH